MTDQAEKAENRVWKYLDEGQWNKALAANNNLAEWDKSLVKNIRELAIIAKMVRSGESTGNEAILKLDKIALEFPQIAKLASFKALQRQVKVTQPGEITVQANSPRAAPSNINTNAGEEHPQTNEDQSKSISKIIHPQGKGAIAVTISVMLVLVLLFNTLAYQYFQLFPPSTTDFRQWDSFKGIQNLNKPVDTLLLGDSTCATNLDTGAFADRLGGPAIDLSLYGGMSVITDAWLLTDYIQKFGSPKNVVLSRLSYGYSNSHTVELMATPPLPWAYWDNLGVTPEWKEGELSQLFITKYLVLYSYNDVFRNRISKFWKMFHVTRRPVVPSNTYTRGSSAKPETMNLTTKQPGSLFSKFKPCSDATRALRYMSDLAREKHFQLYFVFQPEWDEAINSGLRQPILDAQVKYLTQFTDPEYVHIVRNDSLTFTKEQFQNAAHLRPGFDHYKTESDLSRIISIQNKLTAPHSQPLNLDSLKPDKESYLAGNVPIIKLKVTNPGPTSLSGSVSCLARPSGQTDGDWVLRAPASSFELDANEKVSLSLKLTAGKLKNPGTYDLVVYLRQDAGNLSNEIRIVLPEKIIVK